MTSVWRRNFLGFVFKWAIGANFPNAILNTQTRTHTRVLPQLGWTIFVPDWFVPALPRRALLAAVHPTDDLNWNGCWILCWASWVGWGQRLFAECRIICQAVASFRGIAGTRMDRITFVPIDNVTPSIPDDCHCYDISIRVSWINESIQTGTEWDRWLGAIRWLCWYADDVERNEKHIFNFN